MTATLHLMCGMPGSGKTTVARALAAAGPAVRFCPDEYLAALGSGFFDEDGRARLEGAFWDHARELLVSGISVVLEAGHWLRADRDEKRGWARTAGVRVVLHHLDVPLEERWRRLELRNAAGAAADVPLTRELLVEYAGVFQAPDAAELALFDAWPAGR